MPSNLWISEKMRVIVQFVGEFQGCFLPVEECQCCLCPRPWWKTCSNFSQPLLFLFSSMLPSPGLLTILTLTICQPLSCLSFTQPSLLVQFSPCSTTGDRASGLTSVIVFVPLSLADPARLLALRSFHHNLPYLCCCLSPLPL